MNRRPVVVRASRHGRGLFAGAAFRLGETIVAVGGRIVPYELLWERRGEFADNCIRFGPTTYLDPSDQPGRYVNHSCIPNAGVRKVGRQLQLFAAAEIRRGEEIVFDYSTTIGDDDVWTMACACGERMCRGRVRRFGALPVVLKHDYFRRGLVPRHIAETLRASDQRWWRALTP